MKTNAPVLTIDGPSGAGKGTVSRAIAKALNWHYLDSGAIYRCLALYVLRHELAQDNELILAAAAENLRVSFAGSDEFRVYLNGEEISEKLSFEECGNTASRIAALPGVRKALLNRQRCFRLRPGLVADGRDMGTVVFPDAPHKIYLTASPKIRAERRYKQLKQKGMDVTLEQIESKLDKRDRRDEKRCDAPLRIADDAMVIDSSELTVEQIVEQGLAMVGYQ